MENKQRKGKQIEKGKTNRERKNKQRKGKQIERGKINRKRDNKERERDRQKGKTNRERDNKERERKRERERERERERDREKVLETSKQKSCSFIKVLIHLITIVEVESKRGIYSCKVFWPKRLRFHIAISHP